MCSDIPPLLFIHLPFLECQASRRTRAFALLTAPQPVLRVKPDIYDSHSRMFLEVGRRESWYTENFLFRLNHIRCKLPELKARNSCYLYSKYFTCFRFSLSASNLGYFLPDSMFLNVLFLIYKKLMFYRKTHIFFSLESWDILESEVSRNEDNGKEIQENIQAARSKSISYYKIFQY